ncbi:MAG: hypothetical protein QOH16_671 [Gaiellaceae bacterium]|nr:hypothetical protein [Gaiellaceae bacterium]
MQLNSVKRQRMIEAIEEAVLGDIAASCETVDLGLRRALDATADDFQRWEQGASLRGERDEFSLESAEVEAMSGKERLAYVARLLHSIALSFGTETEYNQQTSMGLRQQSRDAIAPFVARTIEIATSADEADAVLDEAEKELRNLTRALTRLATAPPDQMAWYVARIQGHADAIVAVARQRAQAVAAERRLPVEKRAIGLMMRGAERDGRMQAPAELREFVTATEYPAEEIDRALVLLVTGDGRTIEGTVELAELDGVRIGKLLAAELIQCGMEGEWSLTFKGQTMSSLLTEYADPKYEWRSLLSDDDPPVVSKWS